MSEATLSYLDIDPKLIEKKIKKTPGINQFVDYNPEVDNYEVEEVYIDGQPDQLVDLIATEVEQSEYNLPPEEVVEMELEEYKPEVYRGVDFSDEELKAEDAEYRIEAKKPYAFDLSREFELIQEHGDEYKDFFIGQAEYYVKETYGKVPSVIFENRLEEDEEGNFTLMYGTGQIKTPARESCLVPAMDTTLPVWYQERCLHDHEGILALETACKDLKPGEKIIDVSPTAFEVSEEERGKWAFARHSFVRVHEMVEDDDGKFLRTHTLRNYLRKQDQYELFNRLTGADITDEEELLGIVGKLKPHLDLGHIQTVADALYDQTPEEEKILPPNDQEQKSNQEMDEILESVGNWLELIYQMMAENKDKSEIAKHFHGWEMAIKAMVKGNEVDTSFLEELDLDGDLDSITDSVDSQMGSFINAEYNPEESDCGEGSGFGENGENGIDGQTASDALGADIAESIVASGSMDYQIMTKLLKKWSFKNSGKCRSQRSPLCKKYYPSRGLGQCGICLVCNVEYEKD